MDHTVPENAVRMFLTMFRAAREGEFAVTDPTLSRLLAREPATIGSVLSEVIQSDGRETTSV